MRRRYAAVFLGMAIGMATPPAMSHPIELLRFAPSLAGEIFGGGTSITHCGCRYDEDEVTQGREPTDDGGDARAGDKTDGDD